MPRPSTSNECGIVPGWGTANGIGPGSVREADASTFPSDSLTATTVGGVRLAGTAAASSNSVKRYIGSPLKGSVTRPQDGSPYSRVGGFAAAGNIPMVAEVLSWIRRWAVEARERPGRAIRGADGAASGRGVQPGAAPGARSSRRGGRRAGVLPARAPVFRRLSRDQRARLAAGDREAHIVQPAQAAPDGDPHDRVQRGAPQPGSPGGRTGARHGPRRGEGPGRGSAGNAAGEVSRGAGAARARGPVLRRHQPHRARAAGDRDVAAVPRARATAARTDPWR